MSNNYKLNIITVHFNIFGNRTTLASSSAASTSSNIQKGTGLTFKMENKSAIAVSARSPPDKRLSDFSFFPGGLATMSIPVLNKFSGSLRRSEEHTSELQSRFDLVCRL